MTWAPDYTTADDLAEYLRIDDDDDDAVLESAVTTASRAIDTFTKRQFGQVAEPEARYYTARWSKSRCWWVVVIDDLMTNTGLEVTTEQSTAGVFVVVSEPVLRPRNALVKGRPWTELVIPKDSAVGSYFGRPEGVRVTARFGWSSVPVAVVQAAQLQASRIFARRNAPFGIAGSPDAGSEMRLLAKVDPDVAVSLEDYRRRVWAR